MRHCLYCDARLELNRADRARGAAGQAYDPVLGRLWDVCPSCGRWNPVPLALRWETLETWEERVRSRGRVVLASNELALVRVEEDRVVRIGSPSLIEWGGWRYGTRIGLPPPRPGFLRRVLGSLPPAPLEGYDPYGLTGPLGGVGARNGMPQWLASPFLDRARALTLAFTAVPFAPSCPSCGIPMPLRPWDFANVSFHFTSGRLETEATCGSCSTAVSIPVDQGRAALRFGLGILDTDSEARALGEDAGRHLDRLGGGRPFVRSLARDRTRLGELDRTRRVALGIALDRDAEASALEAEWREAEEIAAIMDGELTQVPGFREFRERVLRGEV